MQANWGLVMNTRWTSRQKRKHNRPGLLDSLLNPISHYTKEIGGRRLLRFEQLEARELLSAYVWNQDAAVRYANQWNAGRNSDYGNYDSLGGDGANFVSQCLIAGGLDLSTGPGSDSWGCIAKCGELDNYLKHSSAVVNNVQIASAAEVPSWFSPGDVVLFCGADGVFDNSVMAVAKAGNTTDVVTCAGHSEDGLHSIAALVAANPAWSQCAYYDIASQLNGADISNSIKVSASGFTPPDYQYTEIEPNDTRDTATALPLVEDPVGSGLLMGRGLGEIQTTSDTDYWSFAALAGDVVSVSADRYQSSGLYPAVGLYNAAGSYITSDSGGGPNGGAFISNYTIPVSGTYYVNVNQIYGTAGAYQLHLELARGIQQESDRAYANDSTSGANIIILAHGAPGHLLSKVAGTTMAASGSHLDEDLFQLGTLNVGNVVELSTQVPSISTWNGAVTVVDEYGVAVTDADGNPTDGHFLGTISTDGAYYAMVTSGTGAGPWAQYILGVGMTDFVPPRVTAVTPLPDNNGSTSGVLDGLTLRLSEDVDPATVIGGNFDLREAGPDGMFDTADDVKYSLGVDPYTSGVIVGLPILDGPLGNGHYRFTVKSAIMDRTGNPLDGNGDGTGGDDFTRLFTVSLPSGLVFEGRNNGTIQSATSLSENPSMAWDGSFTVLGGQSVGYGLDSMAAGDFNGDGKPDLAVANSGSNNVSVLLGNGDGTFHAAVNYTVGSNPISVAVGDFNGDGKLDLVTANSGSNNISVLLGNGDGTFQAAINHAVGINPYSVAAGDINGDGKLDVAVANRGSNTVSVLLGNGNGTFGIAPAYAVGYSPSSVAIGDVNGDGKLDLAVANTGSNTVSVLLGFGTGLFIPAVNYAVGTNPCTVALGDISGDGKLDIVTANYGSNDVSVLLGHGNGTFATAVSYSTSGSGPNQAILTDINGDSRADVVVANWDWAHPVNVLLSNSDGSLQTPLSYATGYASAVTAADFNVDGRKDLAVEVNYSSAIVLLSNNVKPLAEDPVGGGLLLGRGIGSIQTASDTDYWSFTASAGDVVSVSVDRYQGSGLYSWVGLYDSTGNNLASDNGGGPSGGAFLSHYVISTSGTYYINIGQVYGITGAYIMHVELARGIQQEYDRAYFNDSLSGANAIDLAHGAPGHLVATVTGTSMAASGAHWDTDLFQLGTLTTGNVVQLSTRLPSVSTWNGTVTLVDASGVPVAEEDGNPADGHFLGTITADGVYYAMVTGGVGAGPMAQYLLDVDIADLVPPRVTAVSPLPGNNDSTNSVLDRLTLTLSKDLNPATVIGGNFDLREAGPDGAFGTTDDVIYSLGVDPYTTGLTVGMAILNGPLGNGHYRFTAKSAITDRSGNYLDGNGDGTDGDDYIRLFTVALPSIFVFEGRNNDSLQTATSLSVHSLSGWDGSFTVLGNQGTGSAPSSVAGGDFNGDGKPDLAVANIQSNNVSVLLGNGDGTFQTAVNYPVGGSPSSVAVGDLNGDGKLDLVVANSGSNTVSVLLGNGNGTFQAAINHAVGNSPKSVAIGNFNGDGKLDLAVANPGSNTVSVLLGNGDGTFGITQSYNIGNNPCSVAIGDFNGDGKADLVTADYSGGVSILLGNGAGLFSWAGDYVSGDSPVSVAVGDLNGDGKLDLATANYDGNDVSILLGNGDGTFGMPARYSTSSSNPDNVILTDINGDGRADVVVASWDWSNSVSILLNNGDGSLQSPLTSATGYASAVTAADFNGDSLMDLAITRQYEGGVTVLLGNNVKPLTEDPVGSGLWLGRGIGSIQTTSDADYWSFTASAGDIVSVSVDQYQDSGLYPWIGLYNASGNYLISDNGGGPNGGVFISHFAIPTSGTYYINVAQVYSTTGAYQMNLELVRGIQLESDRGYSNDSIDGANAISFAHGAPAHLVAAVAGTTMAASGSNLDEDLFQLGTLTAGDVVVLNAQLPSSSTWNGAVTVVDANGMAVTDEDGNPMDGHFLGTISVAGTYFAMVKPQTSGAGAGPLSQYILNVDISDLMPPRVMAVNPLPGNNSGTSGVLDRLTLAFSKDMDPATVIGGNFDLREAGPDGLFDTADDVTYSLQVDPYTTGLTVGILIQDGPLGNGHYRFTAKSALMDRSGNHLDGNGDGTGGDAYVRLFTVALPSVFVFEGRDNNTLQTATSLSVHPLTGWDGSFTVLGNQSLGSGSNSAASGDFNRDGIPDLAVTNTWSNNVSILLGNGDGTFQAPVYYDVASSPTSVAAGDFNGDGKLDIVVANSGSDTVSVLLGNGDGTFGDATAYVVGNNPRSVAVGYINGDGKLDLAVANSGSDTVSVLLGNGDGTFGIAPAYSVGNNPYSVAIGDVNGDGKADLAVANCGSGTVTLLLGNGTGLFSWAADYVVGSNPYSVAFGDLNGDGKLDMATANGESNNISVLLGHGDGTFAAAVNYATGGSYPNQVILTDINGDGRADAVVANWYWESTVNVLLSNSDGSLQSPISYAIGYASAVTAADFNGDGRKDLALVLNNNSVTVLLGNNVKPLMEDPVGSGLLLGRGIGSIQTTSDTDYWSFTASAGDVVSISVDRYQDSGLYSWVGLYNSTGGNVASDNGGGPNGGSFISHYTIPTSGTYYINVNQIYGTTGAYVIHVELARGIQQESDRGYSNDYNEGANAISFAHGAPGHLLATVAGTSMAASGSNLDEDLFQLGTLTAGDVVQLSTRLPSVSTWNGAVTVVDGNGVAVADEDGNLLDGNFRGTIITDGIYYAKVTGGTGAGPLAQYILDVNIADLVPPRITAASPLPGNNSGTSSVLDRLTLTLSKDLDPSTVISGNFDLRAAGPDGLLGTPDDVTYSLQVDPYTTGLTVGILIQNGPLGNGHYRFTANSAIMDRSGNYLDGNGDGTGGDNYVRFFTVALPSGFVFEGRNNDTRATATSLSVNPQTGWDGSFTVLGNQTADNGPDSVASGDFNRDGKPDLVVVNRWSNNASVLLGNGEGTFQAAVNYPVDRGPLSIAVGDFNGDGKLDLVTANSSSFTVSVLLGNGDGTFQAAVNHDVGYNPCFVATGDINKDGKLDVVVANSGDNTISVLLGNGDGTFGIAPTYFVGNEPFSVAIGDINGDGNLDLAVANHSSDNVTVLLGNGTGLFGSAGDYFVDTRPCSVALGDINGDGKLDMATANEGSDDIIVLLGNGDGTFDAAAVYATSGSSPDAMILTDINGDGRADAVTANWDWANSVSVLLGNSDGSLQSATSFASGYASALTMADFNGDGRKDLAVVVNNNSVTILLGNNVKPLTEDPAGGGLLTGRGIGSIQTTSDVDYWSFSALAGDIVSVSVDRYQGSGLYPWVGLYDSTGNNLTADNGGGPNGGAFISHFTISTSGTYYINVSQIYNTTGAYLTHVELARGIQQESDRGYSNDTIGGANEFNLAPTETHRAGTIAGTIITPGDKDYFNLGTVSAGETIFLSVRLPQSGTLVPVVEIRDSNNNVVNIAPNPSTGVARYDVTTTGTYYALVVSFAGEGIYGQYLLDGAVWPTGMLQKPDLAVADVAVQSTAESGSSIDVSWLVGNYGTGPVGAIAWQDRVVLSQDNVYGNSDDIELLLDPRSGPLAVGGSYSAHASVVIPHVSAGNYWVFVKTDAGGVVDDLYPLNNVRRSDAQINITLPKVANVLVRNSTWSTAFPYYNGYSIPVGSGSQLLTLPWTNINEIDVVFTEDVTVHREDLLLSGINTTLYDVAHAGFNYNPITHMATWTLPQAIGADKLLLILNSSLIVDQSGNRLDGEWTNPTGTMQPSSSAYPSGDGTAGGDFAFRFNVLPGDVNQDSVVANNETNLLRDNLGDTSSNPNYSPMKDVNGDGMIVITDLIQVRNRQGTMLPNGEPIPPPGGSENGSAAENLALPELQNTTAPSLLSIVTIVAPAPQANANPTEHTAAVDLSDVQSSSIGDGSTQEINSDCLVETLDVIEASPDKPRALEANAVDAVFAQPVVDLEIPAVSTAKPQYNPSDAQSMSIDRESVRWLASVFANNEFNGPARSLDDFGFIYPKKRSRFIASEIADV
jgi:hypothetical protein